MSAVLSYDLVSGKWSVNNYFASVGALFTDAAVLNGAVHFYRNSNRFIYKETPGTYSDDTIWYGLTLTTGDIAFGNPARMQRVKRIGLILDRFGTGGLTLEVSRDGGAFTSPAYTWSLTDIAALTEDTVRVHVREQKGRRWRIRVKETASTPDKGLGFVALNFEAATIGGTARLGAAESRS